MGQWYKATITLPEDKVVAQKIKDILHWENYTNQDMWESDLTDNNDGTMTMTGNEIFDPMSLGTDNNFDDMFLEILDYLDLNFNDGTFNYEIEEQTLL